MPTRGLQERCSCPNQRRLQRETRDLVQARLSAGSAPSSIPPRPRRLECTGSVPALQAAVATASTARGADRPPPDGWSPRCRRRRPCGRCPLRWRPHPADVLRRVGLERAEQRLHATTARSGWRGGLFPRLTLLACSDAIVRRRYLGNSARHAPVALGIYWSSRCRRVARGSRRGPDARGAAAYIIGLQARKHRERAVRHAAPAGNNSRRPRATAPRPRLARLRYDECRGLLEGSTPNAPASVTDALSESRTRSVTSRARVSRHRWRWPERVPIGCQWRGVDSSLHPRAGGGPLLKAFRASRCCFLIRALDTFGCCQALPPARMTAKPAASSAVFLHKTDCVTWVRPLTLLVVTPSPTPSAFDPGSASLCCFSVLIAAVLAAWGEIQSDRAAQATGRIPR